MAPGMRAHPRAIAAVVVIVLGLCGLVGWSLFGPDPALQASLGMRDAVAAPVGRAATIEVAPGSKSFTPRLATVVTGSSVTFVNELDTAIVVRSTASSPAPFGVIVAAHGRGTMRLPLTGLYQYYDARTARPSRVTAGSTVLQALVPGAVPRQGWIAVLGAMPGPRTQLLVPPGLDVFAPKALVAVVGSTIVVSNRDADAHNFVIDPASPAGAAFVISGTDAEPPSGWRRALVVQQPGLYHVYCTMHTRVTGIQGGWHVVVPRPGASGYADSNPMEAWIVVLPATTTL